MSEPWKHISVFLRAVVEDLDERYWQEPPDDGKVTCRKCGEQVMLHSDYICNACTRLNA